MTSNQFLALWSLKALGDQAYQRYKDLDYTRRVRTLPERDSENYMTIDDEFTWQNLLSKGEWYETWQQRVEHNLTSFREESTSSLLAFNNASLGDWSDTIANRLEKQMEIITKILSDRLMKLEVYVLHRSYYDAQSKSLYILQLRDRDRWKVKTIDFTKTSRPAQILELIYEEPLEHHDFDDIEFKVGDRHSTNIKDQDRTLYYALQNINKKIDKAMGSDFGLLNIENNQVWVDRLHI